MSPCEANFHLNVLERRMCWLVVSVVSLSRLFAVTTRGTIDARRLVDEQFAQRRWACAVFAGDNATPTLLDDVDARQQPANRLRSAHALEARGGAHDEQTPLDAQRSSSSARCWSASVLALYRRRLDTGRWASTSPSLAVSASLFGAPFSFLVRVPVQSVLSRQRRVVRRETVVGGQRDANRRCV